MNDIKIPKTINIGGIIYDIRLVSGKSSNDLQEKNYIGRIDYDNCIITIDKNINQQIMVLTLLHEILHVVNHNYKTKLSEDDIDKISSGLYQIFKENQFMKEII